MNWLDIILKLGAGTSSVLAAALGAQVWRIRSENRRNHSEATNFEAAAASTVTATALSLVGPLSAKNTELNQELGTWRRYGRAQDAWNDLVIREAEAQGRTLPPPPEPPE